MCTSWFAPPSSFRADSQAGALKIQKIGTTGDGGNDGTIHSIFPYKEGRVFRDLKRGFRGVGRGVAIYENPGFPVSKPGVSQSQGDGLHQCSFIPYSILSSLSCSKAISDHVIAGCPCLGIDGAIFGVCELSRILS